MVRMKFAQFPGTVVSNGHEYTVDDQGFGDVDDADVADLEARGAVREDNTEKVADNPTDQAGVPLMSEVEAQAKFGVAASPPNASPTDSTPAPASAQIPQENRPDGAVDAEATLVRPPADEA